MKTKIKTKIKKRNIYFGIANDIKTKLYPISKDSYLSRNNALFYKTEQEIIDAFTNEWYDQYEIPICAKTKRLHGILYVKIWSIEDDSDTSWIAIK